MKPKDKFLSTDAVFLEPATCGSSVRYITRVSKKTRRQFEIDVVLTDCTRSITWSGWGEDGAALMAVKIDRAIDLLTLARNSLKEASRVYEKLAPRRRRRRKKNAPH